MKSERITKVITNHAFGSNTLNWSHLKIFSIVLKLTSVFPIESVIVLRQGRFYCMFIAVVESLNCYGRSIEVCKAFFRGKKVIYFIILIFLFLVWNNKNNISSYQYAQALRKTSFCNPQATDFSLLSVLKLLPRVTGFSTGAEPVTDWFKQFNQSV